MSIGNGVGDNVVLQPGETGGTQPEIDILDSSNSEQLRLLVDFVSDNAIWIVLLSTLFVKNKTVLALEILTLIVFVNHKNDIERKGTNTNAI